MSMLPYSRVNDAVGGELLGTFAFLLSPGGATACNRENFRKSVGTLGLTDLWLNFFRVERAAKSGAGNASDES
jgi:hypothetical protein